MRWIWVESLHCFLNVLIVKDVQKSLDSMFLDPTNALNIMYETERDSIC